MVSDIVTTEGEVVVLENLKRKAHACDKMFARLVEQMNHAAPVSGNKHFDQQEEFPSWL